MGQLKSMFENICRDAIKRYAKKHKLEAGDIQIAFKLQRVLENGKPAIDEHGNEHWHDAYKVLHRYKPIESPTVKQLLDTRLDAFGKSIIVGKQVLTMLVELSDEKDIAREKISIVICEVNKVITGYLYNGTVHLEKIDLNALLDDLKFMQQQT
jgi:hypothetical protein